MKVVIDGLVFENSSQIGIWRVFYETMCRLADKVDYTLWLRNRPMQPLPSGVRVIRDSARWSGPRWNLRRSVPAKLARRHIPASVRTADVFHSSYFTVCPSVGPAVVTSVYDMIAETMYSISGGNWWMVDIAAKSRAIASADICTALSAATQADLTKYYPGLTGHVRLIHLAADHLAKFAQARSSIDLPKPYALFVGHRDSYKNFRTVLDAMTRPGWPAGLQLSIVGNPLAEHELRYVDFLNLSNRITDCGRLSDTDLARAYSSATCFIFPSLLEGFGLPILEAQSNGCPVVCSDTNTFREVAGNSAAYFDPRLAESLAAAVKTTLDTETRRKLIIDGFVNVQRFSWDRVAEETFAVYQEAVAVRREKSKV